MVGVPQKTSESKLGVFKKKIMVNTKEIFWFFIKETLFCCPLFPHDRSRKFKNG